MKKERATTSDEQRERLLIAEQIERAAQESPAGPSNTPPPEAAEGLKRDSQSEKVVLSFSAKPSPASPALGGGLKLNPLKANPLKANPLKASSTSNPLKAGTKRSAPAPAPMSAAERLIVEEQERKRRRMDREGLVA
jgi:DNA/RNA-binding protein KIN17